MKSIYTLTLSPTIDKSTTVDRVMAEHKLRCSNPTFEPGGGGINVSRAIKKLGGDSVAIYPVGGPTGELLTDLLNKEDIKQILVPSKNWSRENFIVVENSSNQQFRFGMPGPALQEEEWKQCLQILEDPNNKIDFLVVSGSTPEGVPHDFYFKLATLAKKKDFKLILDTSGPALTEALKAGVYLCKPNINELSDMVGKELIDIADQEEAAMKVIESGMAEILVVSLGSAGAFVASKDGVYIVHAPTVQKRTTVGAGDSMVAGLVLSMSKGWNLVDTIRYGIAAGSAATMNTGTQLCRKEDVERLYTWLKNSDKHHLNM